MSDNPLSAVLSNKVNIGGREIPVVVVGGGIGLLAAVAALVSRRNSPQVTPSEVTPADQGQSFADQFTTFSQGISQQVNTSLAEQSAYFASQFASFQSGFQGQLASQQAGTTAEINNLRNSTGQSIQTITTNVNNIQSGYAALNQRVAAVEQKAAKVDTLTTVVRNMARWFYAVPNLISVGNTYPVNSQEWQTAAGQAMSGITNTVGPIGGLGTLVQ